MNDDLRVFDGNGFFMDATAESVINSLADRYGIKAGRIEELLKAEQDERAVALPFKVGDIVFVLAHCGDVRYFCDNDYDTGTGATTCPFEKQCGIEECDNDDLHVFAVEVSGIYFGEKNPMDGAVVVNELDVDMSLSDFGKRVFITEAEAERALENQESVKNS